MPLMSEGKSGPSRTKLRAIWRREARKRDECRALIAEMAGRGRDTTLRAATLAIIEEWVSGQCTPVGIQPADWRAVCAEMNAKEQATAEPTPPAGCLF